MVVSLIIVCCVVMVSSTISSLLVVSSVMIDTVGVVSRTWIIFLGKGGIVYIRCLRKQCFTFLELVGRVPLTMVDH